MRANIQQGHLHTSQVEVDATLLLGCTLGDSTVHSLLNREPLVLTVHSKRELHMLMQDRVSQS